MRHWVLAVCSIALSSAAHAADPFYIGTWKFSAAMVAPWAEAGHQRDGSEQTRLMGKTVVINAKAIAGPQPFPCKGPHYAVKDYPPSMIFQGAFDELQAKDKTVEPAKLAASLGFKTAAIKTLETGCEFDFHFVDDATAEVGLNDTVYALKKLPR